MSIFLKFVPKQLFQREFILKRDLLIKTPIQEMLSGYCFERINNNLYVNLFFQPLFIKSENISLVYGWRLRSNQSTGSIFFLDPEHVDLTTSEIGKIILANVDVAIHLSQIENFYKFFLKNDKHDIRFYEGLAYVAYYINSADRYDIIDKFEELWEVSQRKELKWMQNIREGIDELLMAAEQNLLSELFERNITFTMSKLKII